MQLSYQAIQLLKTILTTTGEKELDQKGQEIMSPRRLNGEESAQRRHFIKATEEIVKKHEEWLQSLIKSHNELVAKKRDELKESTPKKAKESEEVYNERIESVLRGNDELVKSIQNLNDIAKEKGAEKHEVNITDKTKEVVKKYFDEFGVKVGYTVGDDEIVEEVSESLK